MSGLPTDLKNIVHMFGDDYTQVLKLNIPKSDKINYVANWTQSRNLGTIYLLAKSGHLDIIKFMLENPSPEYGDIFSGFSRAIDAAAEGGHLETLKWLIQDLQSLELEETHDIHFNHDACMWMMMIATEYQHFEIVKWLHTLPKSKHTERCNCIRTGIRPLDCAAREGNLLMVKWLQDNRLGDYGTKTLIQAAGNGHLEIVKWLCSLSDSIIEDKRYGVVENATYDVFPHKSIAMYYAAESGHRDVVDFFLQFDHDDKHLSKALDEAISKGYIEIARAIYPHLGKAIHYNLNT